MATLYDKRDIPIEPGDLLKSLHFKGRNGRNYWLYHVAVREGDNLRAVPASHLEPCRRNGGACLLRQPLASAMEIISGYGPGDCLDYLDRPRRNPLVPADAPHHAAAAGE